MTHESETQRKNHRIAFGGFSYSFHLFGISVQEEREIVLILAESEKKKDIMKAIVDKCGANTDADGMVVSIPVDSVEGIYKD